MYLNLSFGFNVSDISEKYEKNIYIFSYLPKWKDLLKL